MSKDIKITIHILARNTEESDDSIKRITDVIRREFLTFKVATREIKSKSEFRKINALLKGVNK